MQKILTDYQVINENRNIGIIDFFKAKQINLSACEELFDEGARVYERYAFLLQLKDYRRVVQDTERNMVLFRFVNRYAEQRAPWKLAKSEDEKDIKLLNATLFVMSEALRLAVGLIEPVMPETNEKVYGLLGCESDAEWKARLVRGTEIAGNKVGEKTILFPKPQNYS